MVDVQRALVRCAHEMESLKTSLLAPLPGLLLSAREADTKALHDLFFMSEKMLGQCRWSALAEVMTAVSHLRGRRQSFDPVALEENELYFRKAHKELLPPTTKLD
jgi:hypothetical protein